MSRCFLDTSALVKHYHLEAGTDVVDGLFAAADAELFISRLAMVETVSALALKVRIGEISQPQLSIAWKRFLADVGQRRLAVTRLLVRHFRDAERLLLTHGTAHHLRTLDALQISVALDLWRQERIDQLVVADAGLIAVAAREGLPVLNVLRPLP
jgi:uncharacterized protein